MNFPSRSPNHWNEGPAAPPISVFFERPTLRSLRTVDCMMSRSSAALVSLMRTASPDSTWTEKTPSGERPESSRNSGGVVVLPALRTPPARWKASKEKKSFSCVPAMVSDFTPAWFSTQPRTCDSGP